MGEKKKNTGRAQKARKRAKKNKQIVGGIKIAGVIASLQRVRSHAETTNT